MDALSADTARLLTVAVGMRDFLARLAGDECIARPYRTAAAKLLADWQTTAPRVVVGQSRSSPVIVTDPELLELQPGKTPSYGVTKLLLTCLRGRWLTVDQILRETGGKQSSVNHTLRHNPAFARHREPGRDQLWTLAPSSSNEGPPPLPPPAPPVGQRRGRAYEAADHARLAELLAVRNLTAAELAAASGLKPQRIFYLLKRRPYVRHKLRGGAPRYALPPPAQAEPAA